MPTYKNPTTKNVPVGKMVFRPGEIAQTQVFVDCARTGLVQVDPGPVYSPMIHSEVIEEPKTIEIPFTDQQGQKIERFQIHFYQEKETAYVYFNDLTSGPPLILYPSARWNTKCFERIYNKIIIQMDEGGRMYLLIEKV